VAIALGPWSSPEAVELATRVEPFGCDAPVLWARRRTKLEGLHLSTKNLDESCVAVSQSAESLRRCSSTAISAKSKESVLPAKGRVGEL
jgi:hypothetical protein